MEQLEVDVIRTGSSQPAAARHYLRAGPLLVTLEAGALRNIRLLSSPPVEVLSGIYAAVRDHNWQTIADDFHGPTYVIAGIVAVAVAAGAIVYIRHRKAEGSAAPAGGGRHAARAR